MQIETTYPSPVALLQRLIQFDTSNPPGNEEACIAYLANLLREAGIEPLILSKVAGRPNLVARLKGAGQAPPLLLYGHVDVVPARESGWQHPPFAGEIADGYVWGRGALDMKGGVAMLVSAFLKAKADGITLPGDVILAIVSDEEGSGDVGAKFLVEEHADIFTGVRYALGEFGGFTFHIGDKRFYPIMIAEKQLCHLQVTLTGPGGHGSIPVYNGAVAKAGRLLHRLGTRRLPVHVTPAARSMFEAIADGLGGVQGQVIRSLLNPLLTDRVLDLLGSRGRVFDPLLHHTVSANILHGSANVNVIPSEVRVELDGRLLPGQGPDALIAELHHLVGQDVQIDVVRYDEGPTQPDLGLFDTLVAVLRASDPAGIPVPYLLSAVTDGRYFARLDIQTYGFTPMRLPADFSFADTIHAVNERIPLEALDFGLDAIYQVLQQFGETK